MLIVLNQLIFLSCVNKDTTESVSTTFSNVKHIKIDIKDAEEKILSSIVDSISYVFLETNDSCLIGNIDKVVAYNNRFYILDKEKSKTLFIFDARGKLITKINRKGKGPGEYSTPDDFVIDKEEKTVEIYNRALKKILKFNMDGKFLSEFHFPFYSSSLIALPNNTYAVYSSYCTNPMGSNEYASNILIVKENGKILGHYLPFSKHQAAKSIGMNYNFSSPDAFGTFIELLNDTIYSIDSTRIFKPLYVADFHGKNVPNTITEKVQNSNAFDEEVMSGDYAFMSGQYCENHLYASFLSYYQKSIIWCLLNKQNRDVEVVSKVRNDINIVGFSYPEWSDGNFLIGKISPDVVLKRSIKAKGTGSKGYTESELKGMESFLGKINENDNPFLVLFKIKN